MNKRLSDIVLILIWTLLGLYLLMQSAGILGFLFWVIVGDTFSSFVNKDDEEISKLKNENEKLINENKSLSDSVNALLGSIKPETLDSPSNKDDTSEQVIQDVLNKHKP